MPHLTRLIYTSSSRSLIDLSTSQAIVASAAHNNQAVDVTGLLCTTRNKFLQVLEGQRRDVSATMNRVWRDSRHHDIRLISVTDIEKRLFSTWDMGYVSLSPKTQTIVEPYSRAGTFEPERLTDAQALEVLVLLQPLVAPQTEQLLELHAKSAR